MIVNLLTRFLNQRQVTGFSISDSSRIRNQIYLTIDDGPTQRTPDLLTWLHSKSIPALHFFPVAKALDVGLPSFPSSQYFGLHGYNHVRYRTLSRSDCLKEIRSCLHPALINHPAFRPYFRPPYGSWQPGLHQKLKQNQLIPLYWGWLFNDWTSDFSPKTIFEQRTRWIHPGMIIVLHDQNDRTDRLIQSIELADAAIRDAGYQWGPY